MNCSKVIHSPESVLPSCEGAVSSDCVSAKLERAESWFRMILLFRK